MFFVNKNNLSIWFTYLPRNKLSYLDKTNKNYVKFGNLKNLSNKGGAICLKCLKFGNSFGPYIY